MRYRAFIGGGPSHVVTSPSYRTVAEAWHFALGWAQEYGEHMHTRRELEGRAEAGVVDETALEGDVATYWLEVNESGVDTR